MKPSKSIKPISYLKTHASELIRDIADNRKTLIVTQNGEAKVVVQGIKEYEETQESLALLKILALSGNNLRKGKFKAIEDSFENIERSIREDIQL